MPGKYDQNSFSVVDHSILVQPPRVTSPSAPVLEFNVKMHIGARPAHRKIYGMWINLKNNVLIHIYF